MSPDVDADHGLVRRGRFGRVLANSLSLSRIPLAALILYGEIRTWSLAVFLFFLAMDASDLLDGFVARRFGCPSPKGAALDSGVDFAVLFAITSFHINKSNYALLLSALMVLSFGSFILAKLACGASLRPGFGKYSGTVLYASLSVGAGARAILPQISSPVATIGLACSAFVLALSVFENLFTLIGRSRDVRSRNSTEIRKNPDRF